MLINLTGISISKLRKVYCQFPKMTTAKTCYIVKKDDSLLTVSLPDKKEIYIGRSPDTQIQDVKCSRKQLRLFADYEQRKVFVEQFGFRASGLNGFKTQKGERLIASHGDRLEILYGKYPYDVEFLPALKTNSIKSDKIKKRSFSQDSEEDSPSISDILNKKAKIINQLEPQPGPSKLVNEITMKTDSSITGTWEEKENKTFYIFNSSNCDARSKIASYDLDKTLIKTISGNEFPKDCNDWQLMYPEVPGKLQNLYNNDYKIVIFSNQSGLANGKVKLSDFKLKIAKIIKRLGIPIQAFFAVGQTLYRKPRIGMWEYLLNQSNDNVPVDKDNSFYVGDAAGRPSTSTRKKKDHSLADRLFAENLQLKFYTPEEHFLNQKKENYEPPKFNPKLVLNNKEYCDTNTQIAKTEQEIIIMVGSPASGKSHFVKTELSDYFCVNRDTLGSWQKCVAKAQEALNQGKSVVVDNTNPDVLSRQRYIELAKKVNVPVRCFVIDLDIEHIKHNNIFRTLTDKSHDVISPMVLLSYAKNYVPPQSQEGFSEIVKINFLPHFKSDAERELYKMYLLD